MFTKTNLFKFCVAALLACFGAVGCVDDISDVLAPQLSIAEEQQQLLFAGEGGTQIVDIAANCEWSVTQSSIPAWAAITPTSGKGNGQIAITLPEAAAERVATISFELVHPDYGRWGKAEAMVTIHQFPGEIIPDFEEEIIYYNDFDKEAATQTFGSGSSWPFLDQFEGWRNEEGIGAANVDYAYSGLSARNNSNSDSNYSDYAGSGVNNLFFGASAYFTVEKIDVSASNKLKLTFGSEKYLNGGDSTFNPAEFQVTLSADGSSWTDPIEYDFPNGYKSGRWDLASANFTLPEGTETLYIKFVTTVASAYRLDDVKLTTGMGGQQIEFSGSGNTPGGDGGDGGEGGEGGEGSKANPYSIADMLAIYATGGSTTPVWITGTIIGSCTGQSFDDSFTDATGSGASNTNIVIGDAAGNKVPVQLPNNGSREALSLQNNPAYLNKTVAVYGTIEKYFGLPGIKNVSEWVIDGQGGNDDPGTDNPGDDTPSQATATIADILKLAQGSKIANGTVIEGVVVSSQELNNLTSAKTAYVQDATGGMQFYFAANHTYAFGTRVRIDLSGETLGEYSGAPQISGTAASKVTVVATGVAVTPKTITVEDLYSNAYYGQYVAIEGVQVADADLSKTWASSDAHTSINIDTKDGRTFVVFSSKYSTYNSAVPQGSGTLKGIASVNNGIYQLIFATNKDGEGLTGARFTPGEGGSGSGGGTTDPTPDPDPTPGPGTDPTPDPTPGETTVTALNMADYLEGGEEITDANGKTYTFGEFEFTFTKVNSNSSNFNEKDGGVRFYKEDIMKIDGKGKKISKIVFNTYGGAQYCSEMAADSGTATADSAASIITWTGSATGSVTLTASNSQIRFKTVEITWE